MRPMFRRLLNPFLLTITAICGVGYAYLAWRLASTGPARALLAIPVLLVWSVPVIYWTDGRESHTRGDELLHAIAYVCVGWLNFALVLTLLRDVLLALAWIVPGTGLLQQWLGHISGPWLVAGAFMALAAGMLVALRGPRVRHVDIPIQDLAPGLDGLRIVQISDLHVGPIIGRRYIQRVVHQSNRLAPDLVAITGDIVDGPVARLAPHVAPLAGLLPAGRVFVALGNHDYYSGAAAWTAQFRSLDLQVLLNEHAIVEHRGARLLVGGVVDPAARLVHPQLAPQPTAAAGAGQPADLRVLLAHNPALAPLGEQAGFDLQLSGHTHAGQFFPWTLAVRLVHAPHVAGLSRQGRLWVYVNPGTGSWGPPVRFGTQTELTVLRLVRAA
jgi:predicted MPP superfamily phosphohydrolase